MLINSAGFFYNEEVHWEKNTVSDGIISSEFIDVWRVPVATDLKLIDALYSTLNTEEAVRAANYRLSDDRNRFITGRGTLRKLLASYLSQQPADIEFSTGVNKKPYVVNENGEQLEYNVSHSGDWVLISIGKTPTGIDVEKIIASFSYEEVLCVVFSQDEIDFVRKSRQPSLAFYLLWTRKEAVVKAIGKGIGDDLPSIPSLEEIYIENEEVMNMPGKWIVNSFVVDENHIASIARNALVKTIRFFEFTPLLSYEF